MREEFLELSGCVPKDLIPSWLYFSLLCSPTNVNADGSVEVAPCGTTKVEAALLDHGFPGEEVTVAIPEYLDGVIGQRAKVEGITENDLLGIGSAANAFRRILSV